MQLHKTVDAELRLMLDYFSILNEKRHWQLLGKYIRRAKQTAKENERFDTLLHILKWEQTLLFKTVKTNFDQKMDELVEEKEKVLQQLNNELQYYDLTMRLEAILLHDIKLKKPETREKFTQLMNSPLLHPDAKSLSKKAMIDCYYIRIHYRRIEHNYEEMLHNCKLILELFQENNFLFYLPEYTSFYVKVYFWKKSLEVKLQKEVNEEPLQINRLPNQSISVLYNVHLQSLAYCIRTFNRKEGEEYILQATQQWASYTKHIKDTRLSSLSYTAMAFYCLFEDWENAQIWLDKVTMVHRVTDRKDIQIAARIWQLIICYELTTSTSNRHTNTLSEMNITLRWSSRYCSYLEICIKQLRATKKSLFGRKCLILSRKN